MFVQVWQGKSWIVMVLGGVLAPRSLHGTLMQPWLCVISVQHERFSNSYGVMELIVYTGANVHLLAFSELSTASHSLHLWIEMAQVSSVWNAGHVMCLSVMFMFQKFVFLFLPPL